MTRTVRLDQLVIGTGARITIQLGAGGAVAGAWFVLDDLPRVEGLLLGREVTAVPTLVEHLCGICPVAHHLAGARALEALTGAAPIPPAAEAIRRLLHHGDVLHSHTRSLTDVDPTRAIKLQSFARQVVSAAAGPGHFPRCAVPGGVVSTLSRTDRDFLAAAAELAVEAALDLVARTRAKGTPTLSPVFGGYDLALTDADGRLDLYGAHLSAVPARDVTTGLPWFTATADEWSGLVAEARPGATASRPFLRVLGTRRGGYRVGPTAQLRIGESPTNLAESARKQWVAAGGGTKWARAIIALHALEIISDLLARPEMLTGSPIRATLALVGQPPASGAVGTGWVDGARGLLVHSYRVGHQGELADACISTPTAQNERWLATLLQAAAQAHPIDPGSDLSHPPPGLVQALESAVRDADPCLPCTSAPTGRMGLVVSVVGADGRTVAHWEPDGRQRNARPGAVGVGGGA